MGRSRALSSGARLLNPLGVRDGRTGEAARESRDVAALGSTFGCNRSKTSLGMA